MAALDCDQARVDQLSHVVGQERLLGIEQGDELALTDVLVAAPQDVNDANPKGVTECFAKRREVLGVQPIIELD